MNDSWNNRQAIFPLWPGDPGDTEADNSEFLNAMSTMMMVMTMIVAMLLMMMLLMIMIIHDDDKGNNVADQNSGISE